MTDRVQGTPTQDVVMHATELARLQALEQQVVTYSVGAALAYPNGPRHPPGPPIVPPVEMAEYLALRVSAQRGAIRELITRLPRDQQAAAAAHFALGAE